MSGTTSHVEVVGIGAATFDEFWLVEDFSHEERVVPALDQLNMGGGPVATALCVLSHLGHSCSLVDVRGDDAIGLLIEEDLHKAHVSTENLYSVTGATSARAIVLVRQRDGARQIIYHPSPAGEPSWGQRQEDLLRHARLLHLNGRHEATARRAVQSAQELGVTISFDGGAGRYRDSFRDLVAASHVRIVARDFARQYSGSDALEEMMQHLLQPPTRIAVITDGLRGSYVAIPAHRSSLSISHQPAYPASPMVDSTGCGDVYHGAFLHGWLLDWEPGRCADFASQIAAQNAEGLGGRFCLTRKLA